MDSIIIIIIIMMHGLTNPESRKVEITVILSTTLITVKYS